MVRQKHPRPLIGKSPTERYNVSLPPEIADELRKTGSGNLSAGIREAAKSLQPTRSQRLADAGFHGRPSLRAMEMRSALELIATPMRSDGTWNRDRESCRELAVEALGRYVDGEQ